MPLIRAAIVTEYKLAGLSDEETARQAAILKHKNTFLYAVTMHPDPPQPARPVSIDGQLLCISRHKPLEENIEEDRDQAGKEKELENVEDDEVEERKVVEGVDKVETAVQD